MQDGQTGPGTGRCRQAWPLSLPPSPAQSRTREFSRPGIAASRILPPLTLDGWQQTLLLRWMCLHAVLLNAIVL